MANPTVTFETNQGTFIAEMFEDVAPKTAGNFLKLAREGEFITPINRDRTWLWLLNYDEARRTSGESLKSPSTDCADLTRHKVNDAKIAQLPEEVRMSFFGED